MHTLQDTSYLSTEAVESASLTLECVDDVERCDGLALGVFCVCDGVTDDGFEEGLEDATSFFVDHGRDTLEGNVRQESSGGLDVTYLDTATTSETTNSRLGDALDVVSKDLAMTLGSALFIVSQHECW